MKSGKVIDVSKSSLVSLKAELLRKQEEAQKSKGSESYVRPAPKKKKQPKINPGVEDRILKDEISQEEVDLHQKSREVLEVKSKLYDKLQKGDSVQENIGDPYLVDFREKLGQVFSEDASTSGQKTDKPDEASSSRYDSDYDDDDDDEWVDYVDCLGRTRRCLKEDLKLIKEKDDEMKKMLGERAKTPETSTTLPRSDPTDRELEMISSDMQREIMRQKWEQQEEQILSKKNVYYEDVRFDEARTHGVAYYSFSTEESKREEEQAEFKRLREETAAKQKEARDAKERRDMMKQTRLVAARQRQRARLGLPPLPQDIGPQGEEEKKQDEFKEEESQVEETSAEQLEATLARAAHVRPWDVGKEGVTEKVKVLSQEEWIEKKRSERPEEFAPPSAVDTFEEFDRPKKSKKKGKKRKSQLQEAWFKSKKRYDEGDDDDDDIPGPWPQPDWNPPENIDIPSTSKPSRSELPVQSVPVAHSTRGAAIPPPPTFEYYNPSSKPSTSYKQTSGKSSKEMKEAIEAGLEFLKY